MRNMFANATIGLTLIYMGILTLICLFFSYNWYEIATSQLDQSAARGFIEIYGLAAKQAAARASRAAL